MKKGLGVGVGGLYMCVCVRGGPVCQFTPKPFARSPHSILIIPHDDHHHHHSTQTLSPGATIMKYLDIVHPAAKTLADISLSQVGRQAGREGACSLPYSRP